MVGTIWEISGKSGRIPYMDVKREDFFKSLLSKRTDELLFSARALVARMN